MTIHFRPPDPGSAAGQSSIAEAESAPRRGVLLINLGTPERPDVPSVRRYLAEFLSDPAVIRLPRGLGWFNGMLGRTIARLRAPVSAEMYRRIWMENGSPLKSISDDQVNSLQAVLPGGWRVFLAMRYGKPGIPETLRKICDQGIEELVVLPMYPQYSEPTTGTALRLVYDFLKSQGHRCHITIRTTWFDDHGYVGAQARLLAEYAHAHGLTQDNTFLLFSTHGLPTSYVRRGDPYPQHVAVTASLVGDRLGWPTDRMSLAYQSRFGPVEWLRPYTDDALIQLAKQGERKILLCPISFTVDCLETLEEIDLRYRKLVEQAGTDLYLCPALNTYGPFISALKQIVLRGPRPIRKVLAPVQSIPRVDEKSNRSDLDVSRLVMVGVAVGGRLGNGNGPSYTYSSEPSLREAKRSQCEIPELLREIQRQTDIPEALVWNTCRRFEFYAYLQEDSDESKPSQVIDVVRNQFEDSADGSSLSVNVLRGAQAWHHLLRTAVGLNSALPGERDVLHQLHAAMRLAVKSGCAGDAMERLVAKVDEIERQVRVTTPWGGFDPEYTHLAISSVAEATGLALAQSKIVVIGGSTTSAAVLRSLRQRLDVPDERLTFFYRGHKHGGQTKILRKAIGKGRRVRVHSYDEARVVRAVGLTDVLVLGVDRQEPLYDAASLAPLRDWSAQPLTIIDFNLFGSTIGLEKIAGITLFDAQLLENEVSRHARRMCEHANFTDAVAAAERVIALRVEAVGGGAVLSQASLPTAGLQADDVRLAQSKLDLSSCVARDNRQGNEP